MSTAAIVRRVAWASSVSTAVALGCGSNHDAAPPSVSGTINGASFSHRVGYFNAPGLNDASFTLVLADSAPALCGAGLPQGSTAIQLFVSLPKIGATFSPGTTFYFGSAAPPGLSAGEAKSASCQGGGPVMDGTLTITSRSDTSLGGTLNLSTNGRPAAHSASVRGEFTVPACAIFQNPLACTT